MPDNFYIPGLRDLFQMGGDVYDYNKRYSLMNMLANLGGAISDPETEERIRNLSGTVS